MHTNVYEFLTLATYLTWRSEGSQMFQGFRRPSFSIFSTLKLIKTSLSSVRPLILRQGTTSSDSDFLFFLRHIIFHVPTIRRGITMATYYLHNHWRVFPCYPTHCYLRLTRAWRSKTLRIYSPKQNYSRFTELSSNPFTSLAHTSRVLWKATISGSMDLGWQTRLALQGSTGRDMLMWKQMSPPMNLEGIVGGYRTVDRLLWRVMMQVGTSVSYKWHNARMISALICIIVLSWRNI